MSRALSTWMFTKNPVNGAAIRDLGLQAEASAFEWLSRSSQYELLARNYRCKLGEIDLILEEVLPNRSRELVFVEVRSRAAGSWSTALESVNWSKRRKLMRAVQHYLARYKGPARSIRVDVLARDGERWTQVRDIRLDE